MSSQLGPLEIRCDAPPYSVVQACRQIPLQSPEDVRWLRMKALGHGQRGGPRGPLLHPWRWLWKVGQPAARTCTCREPLPAPALVVFTFDKGEETSYVLAQCSRCRTVFWDEP